MKKPIFFIGSSFEGLPVANALRENLKNEVWSVIYSTQLFDDTESYSLDSILVILDTVDAAVFVLTHHDLFRDQANPKRNRENVIFELGLFMGRLGRSRIIVVVEDEGPLHRLPSDLAGLPVVRFRSAAPTDLIAAVGPASLQVAKFISEFAKEERSSRSERPVEPYSCFVSYSARDKAFAERIYHDLQEVGVRCWLDSKDLKIGDRLDIEIDRAIQVTDKVLLVLSESSIRSDWVRKEIEFALERESKAKKTILFPIRIDDAVMETNDEISRLLVQTRHIGDFTAWNDPDSYKRAFSRLVKDITVSAAAEQDLDLLNA